MSLIHAPATDTVSQSHVYERSDLESTFLPVGQMLQLDRVTEVTGERLVAEVDVTGHWVFPLHFPADPIFPGTLLIEAAGQAVAAWGWHAGFRGRARLAKVSARYFNPVLPQDRTVRVEAKVRNRKCVFAGEVELSVLGRKVAEVRPVVFIIPPPIFGVDPAQDEGY